MKSTFVDSIRSMIDRAPAARRDRERNRRRGFASRILEALEARELLAVHLPGTVGFDEHAAAFGEAPDGNAPHVLVGGLVPDTSVTIESVAAAVPDPKNPVPENWSDATAWSTVVNGLATGIHRAPTLNDNVLISYGTTVTFDAKADLTKAFHTIRVDGTLAFDPTVSTKLLVDTIVVEPSGTYQEGTALSPILPTTKDDVVFTGGPIDTSWDPFQFSRGLITHGAVSIYGSTVTSEVAALPEVPASNYPLKQPSDPLGLASKTTVIMLSSPAMGWKIGDRLIITGDTASDSNGNNQDEQVAISSLIKDPNDSTKVIGVGITDPSVKTYTGLKYAHEAPPGSSIYVSDVSRNVVFESQNPSVVAQRGDLMFMHSANVNLYGVGVYGLGRTDKRNPIDDPNPVVDPAANAAYLAASNKSAFVMPKDDFLYTMFDDETGAAVVSVMTNNVLDAKTGQRVMVPMVDATGKAMVDSNGAPLLQVAVSGLNPRGRYAIHFHRTGTDPKGPMATVFDSAVVDSPGWGIVNHSSNVDVEGNVVYNALGAAYITEAGDESGKFIGNIAIHSQGGNSGSIEDPRFGFGQLGDGFWLQGGNVTLDNNIATGMHHSGFVFFPRGLDQAGLGVTQIPLLNLDPKVQQALIDTSSAVQSQIAANAKAVLAKQSTKPVMVADGQVPLKEFSGNIAIASGDGLETWFSLLDFSDANLKTIANDPNASLQTVISNFSAWNTGGNGIFSPYTNNIVYQNVTLLRGIKSLTSPSGTGFARNDVTANATFLNDNVQGYQVGVNVPVNGTNKVLGGIYDDINDILVTTSNENRFISIDDLPADPTIPGSVSVPINFKDTIKNAFHVYLQASFDPKDADITKIFSKDVVQMGKVMQGGKQLYYFAQAADYVPFPAPATTTPDGSAGPVATPATNFVVPKELLGLNNLQLYTQFGLAVGGTVAPGSATSGVSQHINALIGDPQTYLPTLTLLSRKYTNFLDPNDPAFSKLKVYNLVYKFYDPGFKDLNPTNPKKPITPDSSGFVTMQMAWPLHPGWNVILVNTDTPKQLRAVLVYGDNTPPTFVPDVSTPSSFNQADIDNGSSITIQGKISDDSLGTTSKDFKQTFTFNKPPADPTATPAANSSGPFTYIFDPSGKITSAVLSFLITDFAGNKYRVSITFAVTQTSTLVKDIDRKNLPIIKVSVTLVALLGADGILITPPVVAAAPPAGTTTTTKPTS